jgi:hypothetical protein
VNPTTTPTPSPIPTPLATILPAPHISYVPVIIHQGNDFATEFWANVWGGIITGIIAGFILLGIQLLLQGRDARARALVDWYPVKQRVSAIMLGVLATRNGEESPIRQPLPGLQQVIDDLPLAIWERQAKVDPSIALTRQLVEYANARDLVVGPLIQTIMTMSHDRNVPQDSALQGRYRRYLFAMAVVMHGSLNPPIGPEMTEFARYYSLADTEQYSYLGNQLYALELKIEEAFASLQRELEIQRESHRLYAPPVG